MRIAISVLLAVAAAQGVHGAQECEPGDASIAFVQMSREVVKAKGPKPKDSVKTKTPTPLVNVPRSFGGLKKAGEAAEAEAISRGLQNLASYAMETFAQKAARGV